MLPFGILAMTRAGIPDEFIMHLFNHRFVTGVYAAVIMP
jgi:hypothetical protein